LLGKRQDLLKRISEAAAAKGFEWELARSDGQHDIFRFGDSVQISVPRHREIHELTARANLKAAGPKLGEERRR